MKKTRSLRSPGGDRAASPGAGPPLSARGQAADSDAEALQQTLQSLSEAGALRFDPVRCQHIEVLARRAGEHSGAVAAILTRKALHAASACLADLAQARAAGAEIAGELSRQYPELVPAIDELVAAGDLHGLRRLATGRQRADRTGPLATLLWQLARGTPDGERDSALSPIARLLEQQELAIVQAPENGGQASNSHPARSGRTAGPGELRAARTLREKATRLHADRLVKQVIGEVPADSGPLNPQMLVIRSLSAMQAISPTYLKHLASYIDTLLWLDQSAGNSKPAAARKGRKPRPRKKPRE